MSEVEKRTESLDMSDLNDDDDDDNIEEIISTLDAQVRLNFKFFFFFEKKSRRRLFAPERDF